MSDVDELVARARSALQAGDRLVARGYWRRASRIAPDRLDIWLDLCQITELPADRKKCLEHIVELDPNNVKARTELELFQDEDRSDGDSMLPGALDLQNENPAVVGDSRPAAEANLPASDNAAPAQGGATAMRLDITEEMRRSWEEAIAAGKPLVCIDHPQRETSLRCNRCGAPICTKCAVRTPVGFRCKECIKAQQAVFFTSQWHDYPVAALISLALSATGAVLTSMAGWWFALIISPLIGAFIGGLVHRAVGRRHGRWTWLIVAVCMVLGALAALIAQPFALLTIIIYAAMATGAAIGVLRLGRWR